ncbi:LCP family protein [Candidatus Saccharibacteria bacterium]|nr:LCP family protein [Candidatus Saccharibacteria bacterium]
MKKRHSSLDGFIPRRAGEKLGDLHSQNDQDGIARGLESRVLHNEESQAVRQLGDVNSDRVIGSGNSDIDESLRLIDETKEPTKKLSRRQRRKLEGRVKRPKSLARRIIKWLFILLLLVGIGVGGYLGYKVLNASGSILQGNILNILANNPLKQDANGRSNFLVVGTSEDDPGHAGAALTDSILIISVDQTNKNAYVFNVPRDLYVQYGMACFSGYAGKINEYFSCSNDGTTAQDEQDRLTKTQKFIGDILGIDIQYGIHADHTVIKQAVDAVGGVDVNIEGSNGAPGILDRNFDWRCNYKCYYVKYDNGIQHLDGTHALFLSMARGDVAPTYGLANSNFDREKNQQKILIAFKEKAMTTGVLTDLGAVTKLIDALGDNLRTNIQTDEIKTLMDVANTIKAEDVHTLTFVDSDNQLMTTGMINGSSVVMPKAGTYEYGDIRDYLGKSMSSNPLIRESAPIAVFNGTDTAGLGQTEADKLTSDGYNVTYVGNAPAGDYGAIEIYHIGSDNSATASALAKKYGVTLKTTTPPISVTGDTKFVIIIGSSVANN